MDKLDAKTVRQHERFDCSLEASISVAPEHAAALRPSRVTADSDGFSARVVDCGRGGLGLKTALFIPKHARVRASVVVGDRRCSVPLRVMRTLMSDRAPTYYLGCALGLDEPEAQQAMNDVMNHVRDRAKP